MSSDRFAVFLDNEGPCTLSDNAYESTVQLAIECGLGEEVGRNFFRAISNVDDIWGDFDEHRPVQDPEYSAGGTLKVILAFLVAMKATSSWMRDFARSSLCVVPGIGQAIGVLDREFVLRQISTSYEFFVAEFCRIVHLDVGKIRCTKVPEFDALCLEEGERLKLLRFVEEAARLPLIQYLPDGEIHPESKSVFDFITRFVWQELYFDRAGVFLRTVKTIGQLQKREAVAEILMDEDITLDHAMYVGDSQTDVQAIKLLAGRGLTVLFNGKGRHLFETADLAYIGEDAGVITWVAQRFRELGREEVRRVCSMVHCFPDGGILATIRPDSIDELERMSLTKRKSIRGVHIGSLT